MFELPSDRAPGPDGYTGYFYKSTWSVIKQDVIAALNAFFFGDSRYFHKLNNAFVVLLPKKQGASSPNEFRPITMIHSFGKLASKLMAKRLAPRLSELISANQNAFIRGRTTHDNFKFVQRAAVWLPKNKTPMALLKLDISKAFDTVGWPFLLDTLRALGFSSTWRRWVASLLSTASSRILLNGKPGAPIKHRRGVRQGDSLSPMLFILAMEVLARLFSMATEQGIIRPLQTQAIKHHCSMYADDVILFAQPEPREARAIKEVLRIFGDASGLRINLSKCSITLIYGDEDSLPQLQEILGCQRAEFPITYLGLLLSTNKIPKVRIQSTVDAVARRLPACHGPLMAKSGRLIWIKSVCPQPLSTPSSPTDCRRGHRRRSTPSAGDFSGRARRVHSRKMHGGLASRLSAKGSGRPWHPEHSSHEHPLQARWLWLKHSDEQRAWSALPIKMTSEVQAFFKASTYFIVGNKRNTSFWEGRWLDG